MWNTLENAVNQDGNIPFEIVTKYHFFKFSLLTSIAYGMMTTG